MTLEQKIADAESKYHLLMTGMAARVVVDQNGERVEFVSANRHELLQYITRLKTERDGVKICGPAGVVF